MLVPGENTIWHSPIISSIQHGQIVFGVANVEDTAIWYIIYNVVYVIGNVRLGRR